MKIPIYRCITNPTNSMRSRIIENIERISLNSTTSAPFIPRNRSFDSVRAIRLMQKLHLPNTTIFSADRQRFN